MDNENRPLCGGDLKVLPPVLIFLAFLKKPFTIYAWAMPLRKVLRIFLSFFDLLSLHDPVFMICALCDFHQTLLK